MNGEEYLGNTNTEDVHDLDNEKTGSNECRIVEIIKAKHDKPFETQKRRRMPNMTTAHPA